MSGFEHRALLFAGDDEFLAGTVPFLREGIERGEAALVVLPQRHLEPLRSALGPLAGQVLFRDMEVVGRNPACIIPAWHEFVEAHAAEGPLRGIGEPVLAERSPAAMVECQVHERLLNLAFAGGPGWQLLCPYDTSALPEVVVAEARCSHPLTGGLRSSPEAAYQPDAFPLDRSLPDPPADAAWLEFDAGSLAGVRRLAARRAERAGLDQDRTGRWVLAANEVATNAVRHGGGRGVARVWQEGREVVCEVSSRVRLEDPLAGRRRPGPAAENGRGLWLVNHICDLVELRSSDAGTVVRLHLSA